MEWRTGAHAVGTSGLTVNGRVDDKRAGHNVVQVRVARRMLSGKGVPVSGTAGVTERGADAQV
jgi:hypothetical protein